MKLCVLQLGTGCIFLKIGINNSWNYLKKSKTTHQSTKKIFYRKTLTLFWWHQAKVCMEETYYNLIQNLILKNSKWIMKINFQQFWFLARNKNVGHWKTYVFASCGSFYQSIHLRVGSQLDTTFAVGLYKAR